MHLSYISIALLVLSTALAAAITWRIIWIASRKTARTRRLTKKGIETEAVILQSDKAALCKKNLREMNVKLHVILENGRHFVAETKEILHFADSHILYPGRRLRVKYNPANLHQVIILKN